MRWHEGFLGVLCLMQALWWWQGRPDVRVQAESSARLRSDIRLPQPLQSLVIEQGGQRVHLAKQGKHWALPETQNFPVRGQKMQRLLDQLSQLKTGFLVGDQDQLSLDLRVHPDRYQSKITLSNDAQERILYVAESDDYSSDFLRFAHDQKVLKISPQLSPLLTPHPMQFVDDRLSQLTGNIHRVEVQAPEIQFAIEHNGNAWQSPDGTLLDQGRTAAFVARLESATFTRILGIDDGIKRHPGQLKLFYDSGSITLGLNPDTINGEQGYRVTISDTRQVWVPARRFGPELAYGLQVLIPQNQHLRGH